MLQRGRGGETVRNCVRVGKGIDFDRLDQCDANVANARDVAPLAGPHVAEFPKANRLRFFAGANRRQEFLFEEEHDGKPLVAEATSPRTNERRVRKKTGICYRYWLTSALASGGRKLIIFDYGLRV
jgi:hypothetical protein